MASGRLSVTVAQVAAGAILLTHQWTVLGAQQDYAKGQDVAPAFEGWEQLPDGSRDFLFGYLNRNWEEELDVPVGPDNNIEPGGPDQGQPTHFLPRRNQFVFRVLAPENLGRKDEVVWTLTTHGKTQRAYASLNPDFFVDDLVRAEELGSISGGGAPLAEIYQNKPPSLRVDGEKTRTVKVNQPLTLTAWASDDGIPKPRRTRQVPGPGGDLKYTPPEQLVLGPVNGLRLSWFVYRGAGKVTFNPEQFKVWQDTRPDANSPWAPFWVIPPVPPDGKWVVAASFGEPGTYVLRGLADDGALSAYEDVTIRVIR